MNSYLELEGVKVEAHLFDGSVPALPTTVHWRVDCVTTGAALKEFAVVSPIVVSDDYGGTTDVYVTLQIPGSLNEMQEKSNPREKKRVLVVVDKDLEWERQDEFFYLIRPSQGRT